MKFQGGGRAPLSEMASGPEQGSEASVDHLGQRPPLCLLTPPSLFNHGKQLYRVSASAPSALTLLAGSTDGLFRAQITLTSVSDIRYVGRLHSIDHAESTISLENGASLSPAASAPSHSRQCRRRPARLPLDRSRVASSSVHALRALSIMFGLWPGCCCTGSSRAASRTFPSCGLPGATGRPCSFNSSLRLLASRSTAC